MENVVAGATPTGGTEDQINLGTLISDDFITTFSLSASDVAKVSIGQKVLVTVTSFTEQPVYTAAITQISSLPEETGIAQYEVTAKIDYNHSEALKKLREGMLSDIVVVQEEKDNALRVPTNAITYVNGAPSVTVIAELTEEQKAQADQMGIIKTDATTPLGTYTRAVTLGITGQYYVEIISGIELGDTIVTTTVTQSGATSVVEQSGPGAGGPPDGAQPPQ